MNVSLAIVTGGDAFECVVLNSSEFFDVGVVDDDAFASKQECILWTAPLHAGTTESGATTMHAVARHIVSEPGVLAVAAIGEEGGERSVVLEVRVRAQTVARKRERLRLEKHVVEHLIIFNAANPNNQVRCSPVHAQGNKSFHKCKKLVYILTMFIEG